MNTIRKKAVVIGGSNGIGLAISICLIKRGYCVEILDRVEPDNTFLTDDNFHYTKCDLTDFDENFFSEIANEQNVELLMITAGIGRIADFQFHHIAEIDKILEIDTVSTIKILRLFYDRILDKKTFYTGVMGSIAGRLSSPSASVYSAARPRSSA